MKAPAILRVSLVVLSCIISVALGLAIARGGASANPEKSGARKLLIGLSMDTLAGARWQVDRDLITKRANELGAEVIVQSANSDDTRQISDVQALISRKVDVLIIIPHNGAAMAKAVDMAHEAGIPVIAYDRLITDCDLDLYITFDNVKVGELQAKFLTDRLVAEGKKHIVSIYGSKTDNNAFLFKQGQDSILKPLVEQGKIEIVHEDWAADWKPDNAKKIMNAAITKVGAANIDGVLVSADVTAGGAIQALLEEGLAGKVLVTGQDGDLAACQSIIGGIQSMTIYKPLKQLATRAAELAVRIAQRKPVIAPNSLNNGKVVVPSVFLDIVLVTKENMRETIIADGFQKEADVYGTTGK